MPPRRRTDPAAGRTALDAWRANPDGASSEIMATAVRFTLEELTLQHPGHTVEVRVPPYGAVQCLPGSTHRRGTPPNVVETDATTWLGLACGLLSWRDAVGTGRVHASGSHADLSHALPLPVGEGQAGG
jgi:hypothetical protein